MGGGGISYLCLPRFLAPHPHHFPASTPNLASKMFGGQKDKPKPQTDLSATCLPGTSFSSLLPTPSPWRALLLAFALLPVCAISSAHLLFSLHWRWGWLGVKMMNKSGSSPPPPSASPSHLLTFLARQDWGGGREDRMDDLTCFRQTPDLFWAFHLECWEGTSCLPPPPPPPSKYINISIKLLLFLCFPFSFTSKCIVFPFLPV